MKEHIAVATSLEDPEEYQRAQVRVLELFPEDRMDDSELTVGVGFNQGAFIPAKVGNKVWSEIIYYYVMNF